MKGIMDDRQHKSEWAINLGLGANAFLAVFKTLIGVFGHSPALLADGVNSTSDVAYYIVIRVFMKMAGKPADEKHPYGHRQLESIAALVVGAFVITTAVAIFWGSINVVYDILVGQTGGEGASMPALYMAVLTVLIKFLLTKYTTRVGRATGNLAIRALAFDHRNDIFTATAATIGIILGRAGYYWVDPLAGALVALVILYTGVKILRESSDDLMDAIPGAEMDEHIRNTLSNVAGIVSVDEIHAHRFGPYYVINLTLGVDGGLSVREGEALSCRVESRLYQHDRFIKRVYVHLHPADAAGR
jgi:cation diffusion facilitator family transporter